LEGAYVPGLALVAFDLDDTLFPERAFVRSGFRMVSEYLQREGFASEPLIGRMEALFNAGARDHVFDTVLAEAGIAPTAALIRRLVEIYRSHCLPEGPVKPDIQLYPDAERALGRFRVRGLKLGLVTDGPLAAQKAKVDALGLADVLDVVTLTDERGQEFWKPNPQVFREMADRFHLDPQSCVYVGDNPSKDFAGPEAAGWRPSIYLRRPEGFYRDAPAGPGRVAAVITDLDALDAALGLTT
jgi:putative hydrolase of the HAD superfamily